MTINQLYKKLGSLIEHGLGRRTVCIDKSKCSHRLESDGVVIIPVSKAEIMTHEMADDDGGLKELKSGKISTRTALVIEADHGTPSIDQPLQCQIEGTRLVISIGIGTLAFAAQHCDGNPGYKVVSIEKLAEDVAYELRKEGETGETLMTQMLDRATHNAFDNGSTAFDHETKIEPK